MSAHEDRSPGNRSTDRAGLDGAGEHEGHGHGHGHEHEAVNGHEAAHGREHEHEHEHEHEDEHEDEQGHAPAPRGPLYWRRLEAATGESITSEEAERMLREFPRGSEELALDGVSRRSFLQLMSASLALAGVSTLTGCGLARKPAEEILPYAKRPEDLVPGMPRQFATAAWIGGSVMGLLVESHEGRPTKIEGNPSHPGSGGATNAWAQAEILGLYDPARAGTPMKGDAASTSADAADALKAHVEGLKTTGKLAVLVDSKPSPTLHRLLAELKATVPGTRIYVHDAARSGHAAAGAAMVGLAGVASVPRLEDADVIVALDCDFLGVEPDAVRNARAFARRRKAAGGATMNRLYVVEPGFSITGASADHRLRAKGRDVRGIAAELAAHVLGSTGAPSGAESAGAALEGAKSGSPEWIHAVAADLAGAAGRAIVLVGERQPPEVHAIAQLLNAALAAPMARFAAAAAQDGGIADLATAIRAGEVASLLMIHANPVHDAPADLDFGKLLASAGTTIHLGLTRDETARQCTWHVPVSHFLEAWGDVVTPDGTLGVQQPLIDPLFGTASEIEVLARALGRTTVDGLALVKETWSVGSGGLDDAAWRRLLQLGSMPVADVPAPAALAAPAAAAGEAAAGGGERPLPWRASDRAHDWSSLATALATSPQKADGLEVDFFVDYSVHDGRYANNGWLQELPDPMSKLTWDNAAFMSPATAASLGVKNEDVVTVGVGGKSVEGPAWIQAGMADDVVALHLGYGRKTAGAVAKDAGFDVYPLRSGASPWFASGATVAKTGRTSRLASTQDRGELTETANILGIIPWKGPGRDDLVRELPVAEYAAEPESVREMDAIEPEEIKSLWKEPNVTTGPQWGMTIDLSSCIGCSACTVACQAENNIPIVGKERVLVGREMHWIRVDRYFRGSPEDPAAVHQPVPCMQCENAPCEQVCPVAATAHSDDGLNDMAYNRCIGTRYCANNCPYKVRRFNYFNFASENQDLLRPATVPDDQTLVQIVTNRNAAFSLVDMARNPDVTVRFRGVMEKCTYCVQRISRAKIESKVRGDGKIEDGRVQPACAQACPTEAITFGDINDPQSAVSRAKADPRNYGMLAELNTQPRTTYLARLKNPNPALESEAPVAPAGEHHG